MKYKLVIFDLDGTILNTLEDLYISVNFALLKNNLPQRSKEEVRRFVGNGIRLLIERAVPEKTESELTEKVFFDFKEHYAVHSMDNTKPYEGIKDLLTDLKSQGVKTAVVSNKADFAVQKLVSLYFDGMFDFVLGEMEGTNKKPAPDMVYKAIEAVDVSAEYVVYIGDSEVDVETADNSSVDCIIVDWGFREREYLLSCGAKVLASCVSELSELL